jgi:uncharacterized iron-regulated protein
MRISSLLATATTAAILALPLAAQDSSPGVGDSSYVAGDYRVYAGDGTPASIDDIVAAMTAVEVVFVGETHDDPTGHFLEAELLRRAYQAVESDSTADGESRSVALSLEFFQRDAQPILDEYLAGLITEKAFLAASRPWPRYKTDYRPLVEFAKERDLAVIAGNAPRRYANRVTRLGRESLNDLGPAALATLAPLPYGQPSKAYRDQWIQVIMAVMEEEGMKCGKPIIDSTQADSGAAGGQHQSAHGNMGNQLHSQVLWDATMAYWINDQLVRRPNDLVLHMVGSFHVARGTGIPEQLERYRPGTQSMVVMLRAVEDINTFEAAPSGTWGDFVIQTDESHTLEAIECRDNG